MTRFAWVATVVVMKNSKRLDLAQSLRRATIMERDFATIFEQYLGFLDVAGVVGEPTRDRDLEAALGAAVQRFLPGRSEVGVRLVHDEPAGLTHALIQLAGHVGLGYAFRNDGLGLCAVTAFGGPTEYVRFSVIEQVPAPSGGASMPSQGVVSMSRW